MPNLDKLFNKIFFYFLLFLLLLKNTLLINSTLSNFIFAGIIFIFLFFYFFSYKFYNLNKKNILFIILGALLLFQGFAITYYYHFSYYKYFYDITRYLSYVGIFILGKFAFQNISPKGLAKWFFLLISYHIITGYLSLIFGEFTIIHEKIRLAGEFENIGQFGMLMGLSIILMLILFKQSGNLAIRYICIFFIIAAAILLAFNNTLRIMAALLFAFFIYFVVLKKHLLYFTIITAILISVITINSEVYDRFAGLLSSDFNFSSMGRDGFENSFQWRLMQWYLLITDWYHNYLFFGAGLGQQTFLNGFIASWGEPFVAHSDFVKLLVETGLFGFPIVLFIFYKLFRFIKQKTIIDAFMLVALFFLFCLLTGNTLFSNPFQIFIFLIGYMTMSKKYD